MLTYISQKHLDGEYSRSRQLLFAVIGKILQRFEPILKKHIDHTLETERYTCAIPDLPSHLEGARIVHISDMHIHENWEPENMIAALLEKLRVIKQEAGDSPVVCVFTGDIFSKHTDFSIVKPHITRFMQGFRGIFGSNAQIRACEGNHDTYREHWQTEKAFLESLGMDYSEKTQHQGIDIVTTPDFTVDSVGARSSLQAALQTSEAPVLRLVLSHNLDVLLDTPIPKSHVPRFIMGGHTHNGHIGLVSDPSFSHVSDIVRQFMARMLLGYRSSLISGVKNVRDNSFACVSSGVGENENRLRFNSPRNLLIIELKKTTKRD